MFQTDLTKLHKVIIATPFYNRDSLRNLKKWFRKNHIGLNDANSNDFVISFHNTDRIQFYFSNSEQAMLFKLRFHNGP